MVFKARELGADYVVVHGESPVEPVAPGTNIAAIEAGVDLLAHPGLLSKIEARRAAELGVRLELSARGGHCLGNGLVARLSKEYGVSLVICSDAHAPGDLLTPKLAAAVALGAGLTYEEYLGILKGAVDWAEKLACEHGRMTCPVD
jgi:histidinol phosphatase-like PHP family hydrolase